MLRKQMDQWLDSHGKKMEGANAPLLDRVFVVADQSVKD